MITIILAVLGWIGCGLGFYFAYRSHQLNNRYEEYFIDIYKVISDYKLKINSLFQMNIHYYDDVIFQFVEDTKDVRSEIEKVIEENDDLVENLIEDLEPEQQKEVLGVVRPDILPKKNA